MLLGMAQTSAFRKDVDQRDADDNRAAGCSDQPQIICDHTGFIFHDIFPQQPRSGMVFVRIGPERGWCPGPTPQPCYRLAASLLKLERIRNSDVSVAA